VSETSGPSGGKFLDPKANARSCMGCIGVAILVPMLVVIVAMIVAALR